MNLQAITVIFIIIFLPIILVSNFYIQREMDTITIQNSYDTKLLDATTDAISAFELNTANEDLALIPDSLRSICEASTNVFVTTLATNLGISSASKNKVLPYIPAMVFTLYDGYYIYSPTQQPKVAVNKDGVYVKVGDTGVRWDHDDVYVYEPNADPTTFSVSYDPPAYGKMLYCTDQNYDPYKNNTIKCTTNPDAAYFITDYILKSFIPYSMQYKDTVTDKYDVTINYTLDNFISIKGTIKEGTEQIYYSKSGYLINPDDISSIELGLDGYTMADLDTTSTISKISLDTIDKIIDDLVHDNKVCKIEFNNGVIIDASEDSAETKNFQNTALVKDNVAALKYYIKAYMFSCWVRDNLGDLSEANIQDSTRNLQDDFDIKQSGIDLQKNAKIFWNYGNDVTDTVFKTAGSWNVEDTDSNFIEHKRNVIKNSIQYNLNLAMAVYNAGQGNEYYQMPVLSETEWDKLLSNVSLLAFMQGFPCGLKTYNNYALVTSTKNEIMTNKDDIYYVPIYDESVQGVLTNEQIKNNTGLDLDTIHKIDCTDSSWIDEVKTARYFQSFSAKEIKYDKVYNYQDGTFAYDHVANECYYCVVNPNYSNILKTAIDKVRKKESIDGDITTELNKLGITDDVQGFVQKLVKAQLIADGTIKNNTFKSISATTNYGINTYNAIQKNDDDGNDLFTGYHPSTITTLSDQIVDAKSINGKSFNGIMNDYVGNNKCYEIDITIQLYNPGAKEFSNPFIYFNLGNETCTTKITHTKLNEGDYLIKFTEPSQWKVGSDYKFQLTNPSSNYKWDSVTKTNYESVITGGNIKLKSITFKYK